MLDVLLAVDVGVITFTPLSVVVAMIAALLVTYIAYNRAPVLEGPSPPRKPIIGHLPLFAKNIHRFYEFIAEQEREFDGSYWLSAFGRVPMIVLGADARLTEYVLKTKFSNFIKAPDGVERFAELFGVGIFASDGEQWRSQRKIASHMFSARALSDHMFPVFYKHTQWLLKRLEDVPDGETIDMQDMFHRLTLGSFSEIAFGDRKNLFLDDQRADFASAFDEVQQLCVNRINDLLWKLKRTLNIGAERRIRQLIKTLDTYAYDQIQRRRQEVDRSKRPDIISRFITTAEKNNEEINDSELRDILLNFIIAGRDTTATALTWTFYNLHKHPAVRERLLQEIANVCGGREVSVDDLKQMDYLEAVVLETLRLYPSVPVDIKAAVKDDVLPDGMPCPAGTKILYSPYIFGRSEKLWENASQFNPDRWLDAGRLAGSSQYKFITFNAGPRLCLGKALALMEAKLAIACIVPKFNLVLPDEFQPRYARSLIYRLTAGLPCCVHKV